MSAEAALAAAAASEGDHAGVQSPRSSSLSPPSDPSQQPAASDGQMVRRSTASREVSLSQSGGCTGSSTSKGATMPGRLIRACAAKKQDTSTGEMPEATLQVCANSMAARQLFSCYRAFTATIAAASLSLSCLPTASLLPLYHGSWPQCAAPLCAQSETRTAAGRDARHLGKDRCITTGSEGPCTPSAPPHPSCTLPAHSCLHPSAPVSDPCAPWHPVRSFVAVLANPNPNPNPDPVPDPNPGPS